MAALHRGHEIHAGVLHHLLVAPPAVWMVPTHPAGCPRLAGQMLLVGRGVARGARMTPLIRMPPVALECGRSELRPCMGPVWGGRSRCGPLRGCRRWWLTGTE